MAVIKVPTSFNIDVEFQIPEFFRRLISLLIDIVIEFFYLLIATQLFKIVAGSSDLSNPDSAYNMQGIALLLIVPVLVYHVFFEITLNGQSVGKKVMGLRVVDEKGGKASISQFFIRWLLRISDVWIASLIIFLISNPQFDNLQTGFIVLFAFGFLLTDIILVLSSKKGQRIGDLLARTILIRTSSKSNIEETIFQEVADNYVPSFPQIMQLSDKDINAIKSILETARKKGDYEMASKAADKITSHLKIETSMPPFDFLDVLLKDYNYLSVK